MRSAQLARSRAAGTGRSPSVRCRSAAAWPHPRRTARMKRPPPPPGPPCWPAAIVCQRARQPGKAPIRQHRRWPPSRCRPRDARPPRSTPPRRAAPRCARRRGPAARAGCEPAASVDHNARRGRQRTHKASELIDAMARCQRKDLEALGCSATTSSVFMPTEPVAPEDAQTLPLCHHAIVGQGSAPRGW